MRLLIILNNDIQAEANSFVGQLNPQGANTFPNVPLSSDGTEPSTHDLSDLVPTDLERIRAIEKFNGLEGRKLFNAIEKHYNGKLTIYEVKDNPQGEKEVSSPQEALENEGLKRIQNDEIL